MAEQQTIRAVPTPEPEPEAPPSDLDNPLLERLKFASIFTSNLDEFFTIRVAGLHDQVDAGLSDPGPDGRTPSEVIDELRERIVELYERQTSCFEGALRRGLSERDICIRRLE